MLTTHLSRRAFAAGFLGLLLPGVAAAQRGRRGGRVVARRTRTRIVVHRGHPIRRAAALNVVVHPARRVVVAPAALTFLPVITFAAVAATLPARERLVWQDTDKIDKDNEWTESNFGIDDRGDALFLGIDGRVQLNFADVTFENGEVQVVDFNEKTHPSGIYKLYDFPGVRNVKTVRLVARAESEEATLRMYLNR